MRPNGKVVVPVRREHGLATWLLEPGRYIAVVIHRPKRAIYEVRVQCIELDTGVRRIISESLFITTSINKGTIAGLVRSACHNF